MKTVNLIQGSPEWHTHRRSHWNASDAPAMLGVSPYKTRAQLLRELATGIVPNVDESTQRRFDDGHRFEALARPLAEKIAFDEFFPCVGVEGRYSASFDGLTLMFDTAFEHKSLGAELRAVLDIDNFTGADLPEHYRVQMEQQCMVSGAERVLFMATNWNGDELREQMSCWYTPDPDLRARIIAGWERFERDLANYQPEVAEAPKPIGRTPETLPALRIEAQGMVTSSNLREFKEHALAVLGSINRTLTTDEDFANAEQTVKWCAGVEDRLESAKANVLAQMADVDAVCRTIDDVAAETRRIRLELDRLVKAEKEARKTELVRTGVDAVRAHYAEINATLREHAIGVPAGIPGDIGASIKGLKTLSSMRDKIDAAVATAKISASQNAERVRACMAVLEEHAEHARLFADRVQLCAVKQPDDLRNLAAARIAEHKRLDEERAAREEQRVREAEERGRQMAEIAAQRQAEVRLAAEAPAAQKPLHESANMTGVATGSRNDSASESVTRGSPPPTSARLKLGDINAAIAPLAITCDGLMQLGIQPVAIDRSAKLYAVDDLPRIYGALRTVIRNAEAALTTPAKAA